MCVLHWPTAVGMTLRCTRRGTDALIAAGMMLRVYLPVNLPGQTVITGGSSEVTCPNGAMVCPGRAAHWQAETAVPPGREPELGNGRRRQWAISIR